MSEKRRDSRNRILRNGESQRSDGRYMFKYVDGYGEVRYVYSWRLDKNDRTPAGRQRDLSLREKEKQIEADLFDQIVPQGGNMTVLDLERKYVSLKTGIRHNTEANYKFVIRILEQEEFGNRRMPEAASLRNSTCLMRMISPLPISVISTRETSHPFSASSRAVSMPI